MGVNGIGGNRFNTFNFNQLMNGTAGRQMPKKAKQAGSVSLYAGNNNALSGGVFGQDQTKAFAANYGKAFMSGLEQQRQAQKDKAAASGKKDPEYNHKKFSTQLKNAKRPQAMRSLAASIRATIADLKAKQATGEYDEEEIASAILHAEMMEEAVLRRAENLEKEELAERKIKREELEELMEGEDEEDAAGPLAVTAEDPDAIQAEQTLQQDIDAEMQAMMEEMMAEAMEEDPLQALDDMSKVLGASASTEEDLAEMKKKHRAAEDMAVARADMEYLKSKFDRLQRQRDAIKSGAAGMGGRGASASGTTGFSGFADGAKIVSGAAKAAHLKTVHASSASSGVSGTSASPSPSASSGGSVSVSGGNIDISG